MKLLDNFNILLIALAGIGFLVFGAWILATPLEALARFGIILAPEPVHRIEIRAFYGGLEIGLGLLLLKFAFDRSYRRAGLWLVFASYGALAGGRIVGIVAEAGPTPQMAWIALAVELFFGVLGAVALFAGRGRPEA
ncbi:MAG: DUF4345 family protein [Pseudomonadota bacterium]